MIPELLSTEVEPVWASSKSALAGSFMPWIVSMYMGALALPEFTLDRVDAEASPKPFHKGHYESSRETEGTSANQLETLTSVAMDSKNLDGQPLAMWSLPIQSSSVSMALSSVSVSG